MPGILIVGYGSIGRRHAHNLRALGAGPLTVCEVDDDRRASAQHELGCRVFFSLDDALAGSPEVVFICTPPTMHLQPALAAARLGCHLFIEKPLADRGDGVEILEEEVQRRRLITMVGCNLRFHPGLRKVKDLLEAQVIGRPLSIRAEVGQYLPDWHPGEDYRRLYSTRRSQGGGVILDAIHELDYARWMMGEVHEVSCMADRLSHLELDTEDIAAILLRFAGGAIGEVHLDYIQRAYSRNCQIIGEKGTIRWEFGGPTRWYDAGQQSWAAFEEPSGWQVNQMYLDEIAHFLACLDGRASSPLDVTEGRRVLEVALAARRAAVTGDRVRLQEHASPQRG